MVDFVAVLIVLGGHVGFRQQHQNAATLTPCLKGSATYTLSYSTFADPEQADPGGVHLRARLQTGHLGESVVDEVEGRVRVAAPVAGGRSEPPVVTPKHRDAVTSQVVGEDPEDGEPPHLHVASLESAAREKRDRGERALALREGEGPGQRHPVIDLDGHSLLRVRTAGRQ